ncbi:MAG TPA: hypothetical protein VMV97_12265, partial [Sulfuriferula sp.]|nr:hypothetical protein [Sulfuriferula sp.]
MPGNPRPVRYFGNRMLPLSRLFDGFNLELFCLLMTPPGGPQFKAHEVSGKAGAIHLIDPSCVFLNDPPNKASVMIGH